MNATVLITRADASMRAQLVPLKGGRPIPILRDVTVIGRQKAAEQWAVERAEREPESSHRGSCESARP